MKITLIKYSAVKLRNATSNEKEKTKILNECRLTVFYCLSIILFNEEIALRFRELFSKREVDA